MSLQVTNLFVSNYLKDVFKMQKRYPEWVNNQVIMKALKMREEGSLSKRLNLWIENLLEIDHKSN